jgi:hypothetical protein
MENLQATFRSREETSDEFRESRENGNATPFQVSAKTGFSLCAPERLKRRVIRDP